MQEHNSLEGVSEDHSILTTRSIPETGFLGRWVIKAGPIFAYGILISMAVLMMEVVLRYVFHAPTIWAHETTTFLTALSFVFGGLYCIANNRHIRVVMLYDRLTVKWRRIFDVIISLINFIAAGFLAWAAWQMVQRAAFAPDGTIRIQTSGSAWDPVFPGILKIFLLIVLILMALQFAILSVNYFRRRH